MLKKLKQIFCIHKYRIVPKYDDVEERNKLIGELKEGESIAFSRLHECKKCGKEKMIGSGLIY